MNSCRAVGLFESSQRNIDVAWIQFDQVAATAGSFRRDEGRPAMRANVMVARMAGSYTGYYNVFLQLSTTTPARGKLTFIQLAAIAAAPIVVRAFFKR